MKKFIARLFGGPMPISSKVAFEWVKEHPSEGCQWGIHFWDFLYADYTPVCAYCGHKLHWNDNHELVFQWAGDHSGRGLVSDPRVAQ